MSEDDEAMLQSVENVARFAHGAQLGSVRVPTAAVFRMLALVRERQAVGPTDFAPLHHLVLVETQHGMLIRKCPSPGGFQHAYALAHQRHHEYADAVVMLAAVTRQFYRQGTATAEYVMKDGQELYTEWTLGRPKDKG